MSWGRWFDVRCLRDSVDLRGDLFPRIVLVSFHRCEVNFFEDPANTTTFSPLHFSGEISRAANGHDSDKMVVLKGSGLHRVLVELFVYPLLACAR